MHLARQGIEATFVEKVPFPRYHIGESMTGEAAGRLRDLGLEERLLAAGHPVKHGVNVYGAARDAWFVPVMQRTPEGRLVDQTTWQVRRSVFDAMLLDEAVSRGATLIPGKAVKPLTDDGGAVRGARIRSPEGALEVEAEILVDCSGQATFLATHGVTGPKYLGAYDKQIAVFSQVAGFERDAGSDSDRTAMPGNTLIFYKRKFHWAWAIPLDRDVVSVGVVIPGQYFLDAGETKEQFLRRELSELHPELARRLPGFELVEDVHVIPNYSFQVRNFAGRGFICVGDAHRFVDPIFSFGIDVALHEALLVAETVKRYLEAEGRDRDGLLREHVVRCERRIDVFEDVIDAFWENPLAFAVFVHSRYRESMIDVFAGRNWGDDAAANDATRAFRQLLQRERSYDEEDLVSVPIGSRYHPERAPLWNAVLESVETTERWMRES